MGTPYTMRMVYKRNVGKYEYTREQDTIFPTLEKDQSRDSRKGVHGFA